MSSSSRSGKMLIGAIALVLCMALWIGIIAALMDALTTETVIVERPSQGITIPRPFGEKDPLIRAGSLTLDPGHLSEGYFLAKWEACDSRLKLRVEKDGVEYNYDLNNDGEYETYPLQMGDGIYNCIVFKNIWGNRYSREAELKLDVKLDSDYAPYLCSNQYVYFTSGSYTVAAADRLCEGLTTDEEKLQAIRSFIAENFTYDDKRAKNIKTSYLGDAEACLESRTGLCQDFAVLFAAMMRSQGIPTQLVLGYADSAYHAWNMALIDGEYRLVDVTAELSGIGRFGTYRAERYY